MQENCFDTVIMSDLHLGSEVSQAGAALAFLQSVRFKRLILLGDIFADLNFRRLTKEHWKFLGHIRKLSNPRHEIEVIWVEGNHDHGLTEVMSHLVGIPVYQEYEWHYAGKRHLAIHDQHLVGLSRADEAAWAAGSWAAIPATTLTGSAVELTEHLAAFAEQGITEVMYQPTGPDIARELEAFITAARAVPVA